MPEVHRVGRYEVLEHLASGGMGEVYLARSSGLAGFERHVVLKMLNVDADDDQFVAMFLDEARVVGRMHHQHIAPAYELDRDDDGRYFLVMDYVHGQTAKAVGRRSCELKAVLPLDFTVTVTAAAASALHYAHTLRSREGEPLEIVHRDVSLSNLMIGYDGAIKLIDFGIAKAAHRSSMTQAGYVKGKVAYMSPEQIEGAPIDQRTDIFALGVVLYELATMKRAFREATTGATIERIRRGLIVPPNRIVPGFPKALQDIITTALAVDPAARFQDADAMRRALETFGRGRKLVVGDAAVIGIMERLFESRAEPWQASWPDTARASSELAVPLSAISADDMATKPVVAPIVAALPPAVGARPAVGAPPSVGAPIEIHDAPTTRLAQSPREDDLVTHPVDMLPSSELVTDPLATPFVISPSATPFVIPPSEPSFVIPPIDPVLHPRQPDPHPSWSHTAVLSSLPRLSTAVSWLVPIALLAIGIVVIDMMSGGHRRAAATSAPEPAARREPERREPERAVGVIVTPLAPEPAAPVPSIQIRITTTPDDATVLLDGQRLGHTPFETSVPTAPGPHVMKIRRRGYVPKIFDVELTSDIVRDLALQPLAIDPPP